MLTQLLSGPFKSRTHQHEHTSNTPHLATVEPASTKPYVDVAILIGPRASHHEFCSLARLRFITTFILILSRIARACLCVLASPPRPPSFPEPPLLLPPFSGRTAWEGGRRGRGELLFGRGLLLGPPPLAPNLGLHGSGDLSLLAPCALVDVPSFCPVVWVCFEKRRARLPGGAKNRKDGRLSSSVGWLDARRKILSRMMFSFDEYCFDAFGVDASADTGCSRLGPRFCFEPFCAGPLHTRYDCSALDITQLFSMFDNHHEHPRQRGRRRPTARRLRSSDQRVRLQLPRRRTVSGSSISRLPRYFQPRQRSLSFNRSRRRDGPAPSAQRVFGPWAGGRSVRVRLRRERGSRDGCAWTAMGSGRGRCLGLRRVRCGCARGGRLW